MGTQGRDLGQEVTGLILQSSSAGEYDRRLVILTKERGRISAFARGARRPGSPLMAAGPFCFGTFRLIPGRSANVVTEINIANYFEKLRTDVEASCYGMYFLEIMSYWTRENNDEALLLLLLYQSLRALEAPGIPNRLVRCVLEIRTVVIEGEYPGPPAGPGWEESTLYALSFIVNTPIAKLYTFTVTEKVLGQLEEIAGELRRRCMPGHFKSLEVLEVMHTVSDNSRLKTEPAADEMTGIHEKKGEEATAPSI